MVNPEKFIRELKENLAKKAKALNQHLSEAFLGKPSLPFKMPQNKKPELSAVDHEKQELFIKLKVLKRVIADPDTDDLEEQLNEKARERSLQYLANVYEDIAKLLENKDYPAALAYLDRKENGSFEEAGLLVERVRGKIYEKIGDESSSEDTKKFWYEKALRELIFAYTYTPTRVGEVVNTPYEVQALLEKIGMDEEARELRHLLMNRKDARTLWNSPLN